MSYNCNTKGLIVCLMVVIPIKGVSQSSANRFEIELSDPCLFAGSTLPNFFQRLWINGDYSKMLEFTASTSREKYGDDKLMEFFEGIDFGYKFKLRSRKFEKDGSQTLNCEAEINATKVIVRFRCIIENDTAKIIIRSLEGNQFP